MIYYLEYFGIMLILLHFMRLYLSSGLNEMFIDTILNMNLSLDALMCCFNVYFYKMIV